MANPSYDTKYISMAHCPTYMQTGRYSQISGDSILGLYGRDYEIFQAGETDCVACNYCQQNSVANAYYGPYLPHGYTIQQPTYGTVYMGLEQIFRSHPYENAKLNGCERQ